MRKYLYGQVLFILTVFVVCMTYMRQSNTVREWQNVDELYCHTIQGEETLGDIADHPPNNQKRNIFFLETSCSSHKLNKLFIKPRQACAVESAAKMNPDMDVNLLFASPGIIKDDNSQSDRLLRVLSSYPNIRLLHFNINRYVENTPVQKLWTTGEIKTSMYPLAHSSDILRLLTLYKFGGIYLDLDVVVIKSLVNLPENFGGAESEDLLANGVMGFSKGNKYISDCIKDVTLNFDGREWNFNGPKLVTRNVLSYCSDFDYKTLIRFGSCDEFKVFPPSAFYLVPYQRWQWFFDENLTDTFTTFLETNSYMFHVWNKLSFNTLIPKNNSNVPYFHMASKYCPGVIQVLDEFF